MNLQQGNIKIKYSLHNELATRKHKIKYSFNNKLATRKHKNKIQFTQ